MTRFIFDARTIGDHYPGIGRYAYGLWQTIAHKIDLTLIDPKLINTRFKLTGNFLNAQNVRSPLAQIQIPQQLKSADIYYSPYFLMPYALPCRSVVTLYDTTPLHGTDMGATFKLFFRLAHYLVGKVATRIIVMSESAKNELAQIGVPRHKMTVCYVGLDPKFSLQSPKQIEWVKSKYHLPHKFLLCLGSKRWHKNTQALTTIKDWPIVIVGESSFPIANARYINRIDEPDLPAVYSAATGLIFPSLREGFGLPVIEAMACGTPVVCLPAPGVTEAAGPVAIMAKNMTSAALAEAASSLLSLDENQREAKRQAGLQWSQKFTWAKTAELICNW